MAHYRIDGDESSDCQAINSCSEKSLKLKDVSRFRDWRRTPIHGEYLYIYKINNELMVDDMTRETVNLVGLYSAIILTVTTVISFGLALTAIPISCINASDGL